MSLNRIAAWMGVSGVLAVLTAAISLGNNLHRLSVMEAHLAATDDERKAMRTQLNILSQEYAAQARDVEWIKHALGHQ